jgi:predicted SAM-dependent methyltransferase
MKSAIKRPPKAAFPFLLPPYRACVTAAKHQLSRRHVRRILKERSDIFVELGAGNKKGEGGWVTIDVTKDCDIFWDLRKGLPFPDESITKLYSSHFLIYFSFREAQQFLDECRRALVPGGTFSICVPNARLYIEAYIRGGFLDEGPYLSYRPAYNNTTIIDYVNYTAYMDGHHRYMFDAENLLYILRARGFKNVHLRQFDPKLDLKVRDYESIYAEADK